MPNCCDDIPKAGSCNWPCHDVDGSVRRHGGEPVGRPEWPAFAT